MPSLIPDYMTCNADDEGREVGVDGTQGKPLTFRMTRFLDDSLRGLSLQQRLEQLQDVYPEAASAFRQRLERKTLAAIGAELGVSVPTAHRLVRKAEHFIRLGMRTLDPEAELSYERKLEVLAAADPDAFAVLGFVKHGWTQPQIADRAGCSVPTVARRYRRAIAYLGAEKLTPLDKAFGRRHVPTSDGDYLAGPAMAPRPDPAPPRPEKPLEKEDEKR